jgi:hypothetical protein
MKIGSLENLRRLVHSLKKEEVEVCRLFLKSFDTRGENYDNKGEKLFNEILSDLNGEKSSEDYMKLLYQNLNAKDSFIKLVFRLKNKILESIILDINLERKTSFSALSKAGITIKKKFAYAMILRARSNTDIALQLLDSAIKDGIEYEFWDDVINSLKEKREIVALCKGKTEYQAVQTQLIRARAVSKAISKAQHEYHKVGLISNFGVWLKKHSVELRSVIVEIRELHRETKSALCEYYLRLLEIAYYQGMEDYNKAEVCLKRLVELLEKEKSVKHGIKRASALLNLAETHLYQGNFVSALLIAKDAIRQIAPSHNIVIRGIELQFYAIFYNGEYFKALALINQAQKAIEDNNWEFIKGRLIYLKACTTFCIGDFAAVDGFLAEINPVENDKEGFNLYLKILLIINSIEREKFDLAADYIEAFRKLISYLKKGHTVQNRVTNIYTILNMLAGNAFDFSKTKPKVKNQLAALEGPSNEQWKILSAELVIFEQWFLAKAESRKFSQSIIVPQQFISKLKLVV